jgi:hypothetical protein
MEDQINYAETIGELTPLIQELTLIVGEPSNVLLIKQKLVEDPSNVLFIKQKLLERVEQRREKINKTVKISLTDTLREFKQSNSRYKLNDKKAITQQYVKQSNFRDEAILAKDYFYKPPIISQNINDNLKLTAIESMIALVDEALILTVDLPKVQKPRMSTTVNNSQHRTKRQVARALQVEYISLKKLRSKVDSIHSAIEVIEMATVLANRLPQLKSKIPELQSKLSELQANLPALENQFKDIESKLVHSPQVPKGRLTPAKKIDKVI